jgi:hypothetical protein
MGEERGRFLDETMKCKRYATEEMISRLPEVDDVSGRSKPATSNWKIYADISMPNSPPARECSRGF